MNTNSSNREQQQAQLTIDDITKKVPDHLYDAYIFDLDGTIYLGDELLPGVKRLITELRTRGKPVRFVSNNPTKDREQYAEKLARLGLQTPIEEIVNTVITMTRWLQTNHPDAVVFPIGEQPLINALKNAGIRLSHNPEEIDIVIASYDRTFTYEKLQIAFDAIWFHKRARLVATNPDRFCPFPGGRGEPDAASIIAAIEACTGTKCEVVVGKPDPTMLHEALEGLDVDVHKCVMVGDRLSTDIQMALDASMDAVLVLTGETTRTDLKHIAAEHMPNFVLQRIDQLLPSAIWQERNWNEED
ncbi:MAG TPA: HAD-IIA family hydrolase [Dictyobacter sp.]|jgi:phosphoglycolate/pyridoxal phosphate phosphatase family enzyme|nr:HAD-IIA family hydrolase [Dictyobacter sp.]